MRLEWSVSAGNSDADQKHITRNSPLPMVYAPALRRPPANRLWVKFRRQLVAGRLFLSRCRFSHNL